MSRLRTLASTLVCVAASGAVTGTLGGCGLGAGSGAKGVSLTVTRDFGSSTVVRHRSTKTPGSETVMRFLERHARVTTRYGGGFVASVDGIGSGRAAGRPVDWFFYVNGVEASRGATDTRLHRGDRVWWDRHDWGAAMRIPAVVGSFPEPFRSGYQGKRVPVRIECTADEQAPCDTVRRALQSAGVPTSEAIFGAAAGIDLIRVLVGRWHDVRADTAARQIEGGPAHSGVFARFTSKGASLELLDSQGAVAKTLSSHAGLVAAVRYRDQAPTWVVAGIDDAGVAAAADALSPRTLRDHFAVATDAQAVRPVPARSSTR